MIKTVYVDEKQKTITVEKLGNEQEVLKKSNGQDPVAWAKKYVEELNKKELEKTRKIIIEKSPNVQIPLNQQNIFNCGYLFIEKIYYELGLNNICDNIFKKYKFNFDLNDILSKLVYGRIIFPASKLATNKSYKKII